MTRQAATQQKSARSGESGQSLPDRPPLESVGQMIAANVEQIVRIEQREQMAMGPSDRVASALASFSGRMLFVAIHIVWFVLWIFYNLHLFGTKPFDPFPFNFLLVIVNLEAIFLSTFVLISQNQQARLADRRAKIDLQLNALTEQETTEILRLLRRISERMDALDGPDELNPALEQATNLTEMMDTIDAVERELNPKGAAGPESAADVSA